MKRLGSSDSLGALMSICPPTDGGLEELEGCVEEECSIQMCGELKKRRLSIDQVKALENNFEVENKLEPERKVKLAQELGLQPRQVAVWFQNRRARWKTKQLERDYGVLKGNFDALNHNFESLQQENQALMNEIRELKLKLNEDSSESNVSVKEEVIVSETDDKFIGKSNKQPPISSLAKSDQATTNRDYSSFNNGGSIFPELKDDDSDSSAVLNEDNNSPNLTAVPPPVNCYQFSESKVILGDTHKVYQPQYVKIEEHNFFSDEACNFFSDDQAPTLQWYCSDQWG